MKIPVVPDWVRIGAFAMWHPGPLNSPKSRPLRPTRVLVVGFTPTGRIRISEDGWAGSVWTTAAHLSELGGSAR